MWGRGGSTNGRGEQSMGGITMMNSRTLRSALVVAMVLTGTGGVSAWAQMMTPVGPQWWPSRWGASDEAGASNWMTPEKVVEAVKLIRTGKTWRTFLANHVRDLVSIDFFTA